MAQSDVYTKFLIEYDKAMITSSYPSLTKYEIATLLDKSYLALIGLKVTGNNLRQSQFESDIKAIEDIRPLLVTKKLLANSYEPANDVTNAFVCDLPEDMLYFVSATTKLYRVPAVPDRDFPQLRVSNVTLVDHNTIQKFFATATNMPWVKNTVACIEGNKIIVVYDLYETMKRDVVPNMLNVTYIKKPTKFVRSTDESKLFPSNVQIEINDSMVEELINLAIVIAGEIVESPRQLTKAAIRQLEA